MSLFKSASIVGVFTFISRILGYIRDILIASTLGAGTLSDAFFVAFRLPNLFRQFSAEGAFSSAFIPIFSKKLVDDKTEAINFAQQTCSIMILILIIFTIIAEIFMPQIMVILAPGFIKNKEKFDLAVSLARITFPYLIFISLVALYTGMLNSLNKFAIGAAAPIFLNIVLILSLLFFNNNFSSPAHTLVYAVIIAGILQLFWMLYFARRNGVKLHIKKPEISEPIKKLFSRMIPGIIGSGVTQINLWINTVIATLIPGAVSYLYYADRLVQFPMALIGTAMGTALLPALSTLVKKKDSKQTIIELNRAIEITMFFIIPSTFALISIAYPLISTMFERGAFTADASKAASNALIAYSFGLPAFVLIKILSPGFFANSDTKTPVKIAIFCMLVNIAISLSLIKSLGHVSLALATSISSWLNAILLFYILRSKISFKLTKRTLIKIPKFIFSAALMYWLIWLIQSNYLFSSLNRFVEKITYLLVLIILGIACYFLISFVLKDLTRNNLQFYLGKKL